MTKHTFGASSSDLSDVSLGALRTVAGGDKRAQQALAAGKEYFKHGGTIYKASSTPYRDSFTYSATADTRPGKVK